MRDNPRAAEVCTALQPYYFLHRKSVLMLAFAYTLQDDKAYDAAKAAFVQMGKKAVPKSRRSVDSFQVYSYLQHALKKIKNTAETINHPFYKLSRDARCVLVLEEISGETRENIQQILQFDADTMEKAYTEAKLADEETIAWLHDKAEQLLNKHEIWDSICFQLQKHYAYSRTIRVVLLGFLSLLVAIFLLLEGKTGLQILSLMSSANKQVLSDSYLSDKYYLRLKRENLTDKQTISAELMLRLAPLDNEDLVRVAFRFYDTQIMESIRVQNETLLDLYVHMYHAGHNRGRLHALISKGIETYYANYQRPYLPKERKADFVSPYESLHQSTLSFAEGNNFGQIVSLYPEIFKDKNAFDTYLSSPLSLESLSPLRELILWNLHMLNAKDTAPEMIEEYEKVIFAFFNPAGLNGTYTPAPFAYYREETDAFFTKREELGHALHRALKDACFAALPGADVCNDLLDGTDCSLFSATLSKEQMISLSRNDPRFAFLGVAAAYQSKYPERIEHALVSEALQHPFASYEVFLVDNRFERYSINYAAPLDVPHGFINQLRQTVPSENTMFEQILGFHYAMRYAHAKKMPGYLILRTMLQNPSADCGYSLQLFKNYPKMATN